MREEVTLEGRILKNEATDQSGIGNGYHEDNELTSRDEWNNWKLRR